MSCRVPEACHYYIITLPCFIHTPTNKQTPPLAYSASRELASFRLLTPLLFFQTDYCGLLGPFHGYYTGMGYFLHAHPELTILCIVATALRLGWGTLHPLDFCHEIYLGLGYF